MKLTTVSAFLIGCSLSFALGHGAIAKESDEDTDDSKNEVRIERTLLARKSKTDSNRSKASSHPRFGVLE
jgi:hypothetical protein